MLSPKVKLTLKIILVAILFTLAIVLSIEIVTKIMLSSVEESYRHPARLTDLRPARMRDIWGIVALVLAIVFIHHFRNFVVRWKWLNNDSIEHRHIILRKLLVGIGFVLGLILIRVVVPYNETYFAWIGYGSYVIMYLLMSLLGSIILRFSGLLPLMRKKDSSQYQ
jgi:prepilin signal peptidase PulO-like enzyme (type II secretory pathway)